MTVPHLDAKRLFAVALLCLALSVPAVAAACTDDQMEDPDPCDPTCPPTTENPSGD